MAARQDTIKIGKFKLEGNRKFGALCIFVVHGGTTRHNQDWQIQIGGQQKIWRIMHICGSWRHDKTQSRLANSNWRATENLAHYAYLWFMAARQDTIKIGKFKLEGNRKFGALCIFTVMAMLLLGFHETIFVTTAISSAVVFLHAIFHKVPD